MLADRVLLPGEQVLVRVVGSVRERARATRRLWSQLARAAPPEVVEALEALLVGPEGKFRSEFDRLRRPRSARRSPGWSRRSTASAKSGPWASATSNCRPCRPGGWRRWPATPRTAWVTQLADLATPRRVATLVAFVHVLTSRARDDVVDIFDVVFGDLQRSATTRGQRLRAGELRHCRPARPPRGRHGPASCS